MVWGLGSNYWGKSVGFIWFYVIFPDAPGKRSKTTVITSQREKNFGCVIDLVKEKLKLKGNFCLKKDERTMNEANNLLFIKKGSIYLLINEDEPEKEKSDDAERNYFILMALQKIPESLVDQTNKIMLNVKIGSHSLSGVLDTASAITVMSYEMIKEIGLDREIDSRFPGAAIDYGGSIPTNGMITYCTLLIEKTDRHLPVCISVIDGSKKIFETTDILLGMDFISRYVREINFEKKEIIFRKISSIKGSISFSYKE